MYAKPSSSLMLTPLLTANPLSNNITIVMVGDHHLRHFLDAVSTGVFDGTCNGVGFSRWKRRRATSRATALRLFLLTHFSELRDSSAPLFADSLLRAAHSLPVSSDSPAPPPLAASISAQDATP